MASQQLIRIPAGCETFIALQRTAYQHPVNRHLRRLRLGALYDNLLLRWIEPRRHSKIEHLYSADLLGEFRDFRPFLPSNVRRVLDIGCGMSGIDAVISRHFSHSISIDLVDKEGTSKLYYGFEESAAYYSSLNKALELLVLNGVPRKNIRTTNIHSDPIPTDTCYDLILSLLSWGHHYPVATYLDYVRSRLAPNGVVILDIRRGTDGVERLSRCFRKLEVISSTPKGDRICAAEVY